jgi:D-sedoheptulose 7-phosphate isomerase
MRVYQMSSIEQELESHVAILQNMVKECGDTIDRLIARFVECFRAGHKVLLCGNGGSAADAQHVAGEFVNRFRFDRNPLPAVSLATDTSILTCIGNDYDYAIVFSRQVEALASAGDIVVGISTSGRSKNVLLAIEAAKARGATTVGVTGAGGKESMGSLCDYCLAAPSTDTPRVQESHEFFWHVLCGAVEREMFSKPV